MSNYSSLEEAYGSPFGQRQPVTHEKKDLKTAKSEFTSLSQKSEDSLKKMAPLLASVEGSLPLDTSQETGNYSTPPVTESFVPKNQKVRETFFVRQPQQDLRAQFQQGDDQQEKLNRILRLIEQNKTGYEKPATQDMLLYIFTGVFFVFTLDTFVMLGKIMRRNP